MKQAMAFDDITIKLRPQMNDFVHNEAHASLFVGDLGKELAKRLKEEGLLSNLQGWNILGADGKYHKHREAVGNPQPQANAVH